MYNKVLLVLRVLQADLVLLVLRGPQESPLPLCLGREVMATTWRTFSVTCRVLASEVFLALLVLKVHRDHRVHQVVTLDQFHMVETSLGRASALKFRTI